MDKKWKTGNHDIQILTDMSTMPIKDVHTKYYPGRSALEAGAYFNNLFQKIKHRKENYEDYLKQVRRITKKSPYVEKRLIIPEQKDELTHGAAHDLAIS